MSANILTSHSTFLSTGLTTCTRCSEIPSTNSYECIHCLKSFCVQCIIQHHHNDIKHEFIQMKNQIDEILSKFLHHAHGQTEWTNHLAEDRKRLDSFIQHIEIYYKSLPIITIPSYRWINHINDLISKRSWAIHENCCTLMYPLLDQK